MKKSTYIILGCALAGLVWVSVATGMLVHKNIKFITEYTLGGDSVATSIGNVDRVTFVNEKQYGKVNINNIRGITIMESDTARTTTLHTTSGWLPYLKCENDSGSLTVSVDYGAILESFNKESSRRTLNLRSADISIATVIMPRGQLREVASRTGTIYLDSVSAKELLSKVDGRLVLQNSHIALLNSRAKKISELKLENSTVDEANMLAVSRDFSVTCTTAGSVIDKMYVGGIYRNSKKVNMKFGKANIRNFKFNSDCQDVRLNIDTQAKAGETYTF